MIRLRFPMISILLGVASTLLAPSAHACATCFGASDSPMAQGMNWGIFTLLIVVGFILSAIAAFFIFLAKRSAQTAAGETSQEFPLETNNVKP